MIFCDILIIEVVKIDKKRVSIKRFKQPMKRPIYIIIILLSTFISLSLYAEDEQSNPFMKIRVLGGLGLGYNNGLAEGNTTNNFSQEIRVQVMFNLVQNDQPYPRSDYIGIGKYPIIELPDSELDLGLDLGYIHALTTGNGPVNYFQISFLIDTKYYNIFVMQFGLGVAIPEGSNGRAAGNGSVALGLEIPVSRTFAIPVLLRYDIFIAGDDIDKKNPADAISIFRLLTGLTMKF